MKIPHLAFITTLLLVAAGCAANTNTTVTTNNNSTPSTLTNLPSTPSIMNTATSFSTGLQIPATDISTFTTTASGLQYKDLNTGSGAVAKVGDSVSVDYTGVLTNGTKFDSSLDRGQPFSFTVGIGQVIKGWDEGVAGMTVGQERILIIPANLGYGSSGAGNVIPPNATLQFQVRLNAIQ